MLSGKQQKFVSHILKGQNAKAAYIKAGYKGRGNIAESAASRLLRNVKVEKEINKSNEKVAQNVEITVEKVVFELVSLAFQKKKESPNKIKALDMLMKHLGAYAAHEDKYTSELIIAIIDGLPTELGGAVRLSLGKLISVK